MGSSLYYDTTKKPSGYKDNPNARTEGWTQMDESNSPSIADMMTANEAAGANYKARSVPSVARTPAPSAAAAPASPAMPALSAALTSGTSAAGAATTGGDGGAKIVAPEPAAPSMQSLAGGGSMDMGGGAESLGAPSSFRQGIGKRIYPQESAALAALRKAY